jgi:transposase
MITIPAVLECCAGIDVGKRGLAVAVMTGPADKEAKIQTRWLGTTVPELEALREWLVQEGVTSVAMESTASYWIPVKNILEKSLKVMLVCSKKHHPKKGAKTDFRDAIQLAHLHRHGMLTGSYMPERGVVELRDLTRRRKKLQGNLCAEKNRIQKVLEVANVKIGNVISDVFGVSGQEMLEALVSGREIEAEEIAEMAKNRQRTKIPQLTETLKGHLMNDHHRWLIQQSIDHVVLLDRQLEELEDRIMVKIEPYRKQFDLICTVPGIKDQNGAAILAEIGPDMSVFPTGDDLCSWAGRCSGNNRSAGKNKSGRTKKANKFLACALGQAATGAARKKDCIMRRKFQRWVKRMTPKKANVAVAHSLLKVIWCMLKNGEPYREPDPGVMHEMERQKLVHHHARRLRALGAEPEAIEVIVEQLLHPDPTPEETKSNVAIEEAGPAAETQDAAPSTRSQTICPPKGRGETCRGKLGFRARQTRNLYSNIKEQPGKRSRHKSTDLPGNKKRKRSPRRKESGSDSV